MKPSPFRLLIVLCLLVLSSSSQNRIIDSLSTLLKTDKEDTNQVNHLNGISFECRATDPVKAFETAKQAEALAGKLNYLKGVTTSNVWMGTAILNQGKTEESFSYLNKGNELAKEYNFPSLQSKALISLAIANSNLGNFKETLAGLNECIKILEVLKDKKNIANVYTLIGNTHNSQGNYSDALTYQLKSLTLRRELKDKNGEAASYNNLGNVYKSLGNLSEALGYYRKAEKLNIETGNKSWLANNYANISTVYYQLALATQLTEIKTQESYFVEARQAAQKALDTKAGINDANFFASVYHNIALMDVSQGKFARQRGDKKLANEKLNEALASYKKVLEMREQTHNKDGLSKVLGNIAIVYGELGKYDEGRKYFLESLKISEEIGSLEQQKSDYRNMATFDSIQGNYKNAFLNYQMFIRLRDSMDNKENTEKMISAQLNYEFEVKRTADSVKTMERENSEHLKHEQEIKQQKLYTFGGIIGFALMIVVAAVSFKAYRQKQKTNAIITEQKIRLEVKQKEVMDSIEYAKRIQTSLMPNDKYIQKKLDDLKRKG
ncbi:MAG: protein serine/threonine phosphatase [Bacteroidetes bacterium]|jgi:tetratricopeptide (TPR) repeat protein|nr:protein serine/threonine phosphatase [Bacteroidota bacterium]